MSKKLYRSATDNVIAGVCGGLGEYFSVDPLLFRILFLLMALGGGGGLLAYVILWLAMPLAPSVNSIKQNNMNEPTFPPAHPRRNWLGMALIIIGLVMLLDRLLPAGWFDWGLFWAMLILVMGLVIYFKRQN